MKRTLVILAFTCLCLLKIKAQFIAPDPKDRSSVLNQPSSIGLSVDDTKITVGFNNIGSMQTYENKILAGVRYKGGLENGFSGIVDDGKITYGNEINGFLGYSFMTSTAEEKRLRILRDSIDSMVETVTSRLKASVNKLVSEFISLNKSNLTAYQESGLRAYIFGSDDPDEIIEITDITLPSEDKSISAFLHAYDLNPELKDPVKILFTEISDTLKKNETIILNLVNAGHIYQRSLNKIQSDGFGKPRFTFFITGSYNNHNFSLIDNSTTGSLEITDIKFHGGKIGIGGNVRLKGKTYIGLLYDLGWSDNFSDLAGTTCSFTISDTVGSQIYKSKTELKAYTGSYIKYRQHIIGLDFVNLIPFSDMSRIALNAPYLRYNVYSGTIKNKSLDLGISASFYKASGRFLFGLFSQVNDLFGSIPGSLINSLSIGFRVNYSLFTELTQ